LRFGSSTMLEFKRMTKIFKNYINFLCIFSLILTSTLSLNSQDLQLNPARADSLEAIAGLVLNGIIISEQEHRSVALLKDNRNGENQILKIGETIENFKLAQILENRIVFEKNIETYQLFLGRSGVFNATQIEGTRLAIKKVTQAETKVRQTPVESVITKGFSRSYLEKRILTEWKMILDQTEISPHTIDGQVRGFKLTKIPEGSLLSEIGLQRNDIILRLNGEELKDKAFIISLIDKFKNDDRGELTIKRNGRLIRLELVLR
jgi:general secretion pathway protein C